MSKFDLPQEVTKSVNGAMKENGAIKLPFPAPVMWWMNGKTAFKGETEIKDARRFGGWGISKEELDELGIQPAPSWKLTDLTNATGGTYQAYICRTAWVAPIARRSAWFENEGKSRSAVNILAFLFLRNAEGAFLQYGPVVLSAKSYTGMALDSAFKKFTSMTVDTREGASSQFFMHGIGTFGDTPQFQDAKGKNNQSSSITPPQLAIPQDGFTPAKVESYFVGQEIAARMAKYAKDAKEWLADWNDRNTKKNAEAAKVEERPTLDEEDPFI